MEWNSTNIIGRVKERYEEIFRPDRRWNVWRGFYNGWLEGRTDMLQEINKESNECTPQEIRLRRELIENTIIAWEYYNEETGHRYIDYKHDPEVGYTMVPLYKLKHITKDDKT